MLALVCTRLRKTSQNQTNPRIAKFQFATSKLTNEKPDNEK